MSKNIVFSIFGYNRAAAGRQFRTLLVEELHAVYRSCSIVWVVKYTRFLCTNHVARAEEEARNTFIILIQELAERYCWWHSLCIIGVETLYYSNRGLVSFR
jgi:hypothetical protein